MKAAIIVGILLAFSTFVKLGFLNEFNGAVFEIVDKFLVKNFYDFFLFFTHFSGSEAVVIIWTFAMFFLWTKREYRLFLFSLYLTFCIIPLTLLLKYSLKVERPEHDLITTTGYSYPSGHASMALLLYFIGMNFVESSVKDPIVRFVLELILFFYLLLSLLSRLVLHVHYFSDIVGSVLLALFCYVKVKNIGIR